MKFTDGYWLLRNGVEAHYAVQAYDVEKFMDESGFDALRVYAPERRIRDRGDTLNGGLLTIEYSSPAPDLIKVCMYHFSGNMTQSPKFDLKYRFMQDFKPEVEIYGNSTADKLSTITRAPDQINKIDESGTPSEISAWACLRSGALSVQIPLDGDDWNPRFMAADELLTACDAKSTGYSRYNDTTYMHEMLRLVPGTLVYGMGERFGPFIKNGQSVDIWNKDGGTSSEQAYKNVPFYLTNRGYGIFVNHPGLVSFEVASEKISRVQFSVEGEALEYFIIYGPSPRDILKKYCNLSGMPALPPAWSMGLWLTTSFTTSYDEKTVSSFIDGMEQRKLPLSVFHFDCFWMREYSWCDFTWDPRTFPDPSGMIQRIKDKGLRICVWINPYIAQRSPLFKEGVSRGFLLKKKNGDVWQTDLWQAGMGIVDFTNPDACAWYTSKLKRLLDMGVDCFKTDFGERIPVDVVYHDGADPVAMHNYYAYLYNKIVFQLLEKEKGKGEAVLFARSATAGCQKFPAHWGGDCESTYESMAETLRGGLSLSLSGFGFWSHDIGGFEGMPRPDVYKRWIAFGLLSPLSRLHGSSSYRVPWLFDQESVDVLRHFSRIKNSLMPYLYQKAVEASQEGVPMLRAMFLEFPDDPTAAYLDMQYMLGDALMVAPVFDPSGCVQYYIPEGIWTEPGSTREIQGPCWVQDRCTFMELPVFVRPGTLLPVGSSSDRPDYEYADRLQLEAYVIDDGTEVSIDIPDLSGKTQAVCMLSRSSSTITVSTEGAIHNWSVLFVNIHAAKAVNGCTLEKTKRGFVAHPEAKAFSIDIV